MGRTTDQRGGYRTVLERVRITCEVGHWEPASGTKKEECEGEGNK